MRYLIVSSRHSPSEGGIGASVRRFIQAVAPAGWNVHLMTRAGHEPIEGVVVHDVQTEDARPSFARRVEPLRRIDRIRPYRYGLWSLAVAEALLRLEPAFDVVEFVDCQAEGLVALSSHRVRERWAGVPMILACRAPMWLIETLSGFDAQRFGRSIYHAWEREALDWADGVWAPSLTMLQQLPSRGLSAVIPEFLPAIPMHVSRGSVRRTLLVVGDVQPAKGVGIWAQSLNDVLRTHVRARAVLIGADTPTGPGGTSCAAWVRSLIDPELRPRFSFLGPQPHDRVQHAISEAAAVVVPSLLESFSYVAAEAMLAGTPVITTAAVGIAECAPSLRQEAVGDIAGLAAAQSEVLADPDAALAHARRCAAEVKSACDPVALLARRGQFIQDVRSKLRPPTFSPGLDAIDRMRAELRHIELQEANEPSLVGVPS
jgi:glycosyltransferase involved in cell wall biosynthesis